MVRPSHIAFALAASGLCACDGAPSDAAPDAPASMSMPDSTPDASNCGLRTGKRGKTNRTINAGGLDRTYIVYLPETLDPKKPVPLVYIHHGYTMSADSMFDITGYPAIAENEGVALVFPDGQAGPNSLGAPWNVGQNVCPADGVAPPNATGDDFAMLDAIRADVEQDQCVDGNHVFVTGFSMGGYFSHHAGCMRPDIRAVAPHSGGTHALDDCTSGHKPIIMFHGTSDPVIPDGCDDPDGTPVDGVTPAATAWAAKNGCGTTRTTVAVKNGSCAYYDGCPADGQVAICTFNSMGHCWAGGSLSLYGCPDYESATNLEWDFFKKHAW